MMSVYALLLIARFYARARSKFEVRGDWLLSASCTDDVCGLTEAVIKRLYPKGRM